VVAVSLKNCGNQMLRRTFGEVSFLLVHYCAAHGYWIHEGELKGIASYIERGGEILELEQATELLEERTRRLENENRRLEDRARSASGGFTPLIFPF
jgi:hypothetical protein